MKANHLILGGMLLALLFAGCQRQPDHSGKIQSLDKLLVQLDSAELVFSEVDRSEGIELRKKIDADVKRIAANYTEEMSRETASLVSQYKSTGNIVKNWGKRHKRISREIERTRKQLQDLKKALEIGATEDQDGNAFTPEYVEKVYTQECTVAEHLIEEIEDMHERQSRARSTYEKYEPSVERILEQLPAEEN